MAQPSELGIGISARQMADGKWVKTIVLMLPIRLAILAATSMEAAAMMLVLKNSDPNWPSLM